MKSSEREALGVGCKRLLGRATCLIAGHRYYVLQEFGGGVRRVQCPRCGGDWGMNDRVRAIVPWDAELEDLQRWFGKPIRQPRFSDGTPHRWPSSESNAR